MAHARGADARTGHRPGVLGSLVLVTPGGLFRSGCGPKITRSGPFCAVNARKGGHELSGHDSVRGAP
jgi:hypothetical protein